MKKSIWHLWVVMMILMGLAGCAPEERCHTGQASGTVLRILFIGNSYTYTNDLPGTFARLACAGGHQVKTGMAATGGWTLSDHVASNQTTDLIKNQPWDWVILQEQSEVPAVQSSRTQLMFPAVRKLVTLIKAAGAQPLLFLTWGHKDGAAEYGLPGYANMQAQLDQGYNGIAREQGVQVLPVGDAWAKAVAQSNSINLWQDDGSHPTESGTYLAACVFYAAIFNHSPFGSDYRAGLSQDESQALQTFAAETVIK